MLKKSHSCYDCRFYDGRGNCMWFRPKKNIPDKTLVKGCKFYEQQIKIVSYIIKVFKGEII